MPNSFTQGYDLGYEIWTGNAMFGHMVVTYIDNAHHTQKFLLTLPNFGYRSIITMPLDIVELDNGKWATRDEGTLYDRRQCECTTFLDATYMTTFINAFGVSANARGRYVSILMDANSGFFPFGADKGDVGPFSIDMKFTAHGIGKAPYKYFQLDMLMTHVGTWPAYTKPAQDTKGQVLVIDGGGPPVINRLIFPQDWFNPMMQYKSYGTLETAATAEYIDRGVSADTYTSEFTLRMNEKKAAWFTYSLTTNIRAGIAFMLNPADYYAFGLDKGNSVTHQWRLLSPTIETTHVGFDDFRMPLNIGWISN